MIGAATGGSLTPPPASLGGLGIFGAGAQRFSTAPGSDRAAAAAFGGPQAALAAAAAAAAGLGIRSGVNGTALGHLGGGGNINLISNPTGIFNANAVGGAVTTANKIRHNSSEKAASNRSKLLEDFRYVSNK